jgi:predicted Zn-dependent protease
MTGRSIHRQRRVVVAGLMTTLVIAATTTAALARQPEPTRAPAAKVEDVAYDRLIEVYRGGATDRAIDDLHQLLTREAWQREGDPQRRIDTWILKAERQNRQADLEALFLLCTEAILKGWPERSPYRMELMPYWVPLERLEGTLRRMNPKSPFLRAWYLLWESFRQLQINYRWQAWPEYLDEALAAFPADAQILLAAGARQELEWWVSFENAQRDLRREPAKVTGFLTAGRDYLRRSVAADPRESEARLRLAHVLLELNDLDEAANVLSDYEWKPDERAFEYLARLFEGDLHERRGDIKAAVAAYDRAIELVAMPQSARIAKAHALHLDGRRSDAAATATEAVTERGSQSDPWWPYIHGQAWRFEAYLKIARAMILK